MYVKKLHKGFKIKEFKYDEVYPHRQEIYMENYKISKKNIWKSVFSTVNLKDCEKPEKE